MSFELGDHDRERPQFDWRNFTAGTVVSAGLVGVFGVGTVILFQVRTPAEEGVNIGGATLGMLLSLPAAALGGGFTARRARRRGGQPRDEGVAAAATSWGLAVVGPEVAINLVADPAGGAATVAAVLIGVTLGLLPGRVGRRPGHRPGRGHRQA